MHIKTRGALVALMVMMLSACESEDEDQGELAAAEDVDLHDFLADADAPDSEAGKGGGKGGEKCTKKRLQFYECVNTNVPLINCANKAGFVFACDAQNSQESKKQLMACIAGSIPPINMGKCDKKNNPPSKTP